MKSGLSQFLRSKIPGASVSKLELALSSFTARSPSRDAEIDRERFLMLRSTINELIDAIATERRGIVQRVKRVVEDPDPSPPTWTLGRQPGISKAEFVILENRLGALDRQVLELQRIEEIVLSCERDNASSTQGALEPDAAVDPGSITAFPAENLQ